MGGIDGRRADWSCFSSAVRCQRSVLPCLLYREVDKLEGIDEIFDSFLYINYEKDYIMVDFRVRVV